MLSSRPSRSARLDCANAAAVAGSECLQSQLAQANCYDRVESQGSQRAPVANAAHVLDFSEAVQRREAPERPQQQGGIEGVRVRDGEAAGHSRRLQRDAVVQDRKVAQQCRR